MEDNEGVRILTSIKSDLYRRKMFKGTLTALLGLGLLFYLGSFATPQNFHLIGLPILFFGGFLIAASLSPLWRLAHLEQNPNELIATSDHVQYIVNNDLMITLPIDAVSEMRFVEKKDLYGIAFNLKNPGLIIVHTPRFNLERFMQRSKKETGADLFLPYFRRRAVSRLGFLKRSL